MGTRDDEGAAKPGRKPLPAILLKRAAIFFLLIDGISLFFWIVGSYTSFLDSTQAMLLEATRIASLFLLFDAIVGEAATFGYAIAERRSPRIAALLGYVACLLVGALGLLLADALLLLGRGL